MKYLDIVKIGGNKIIERQLLLGKHKLVTNKLLKTYTILASVELSSYSFRLRKISPIEKETYPHAINVPKITREPV